MIKPFQSVSIYTGTNQARADAIKAYLDEKGIEYSFSAHNPLATGFWPGSLSGKQSGSLESTAAPTTASILYDIKVSKTEIPNIDLTGID